MTMRVACWMALMAFSFTVLVGRGPVSAAPEYEQRVFAVVVNGEPVSSGSVLLQAGDGTILAAADDLRRWRIKPPGHGPRTALDGRSYFALSDFPGVTARVDESRQILDLRVPPALFEATTLDLTGGGARRFDRNAGAFVNYWFNDVHFSGQSFDQGIFELGASGVRGGVLTTSLGWQPSSRGSAFERLNTTWERDFANARRTLRVGDGVSSPGRLGGSVSFAGVQVASDFATDPEFQVSPALAVRGINPTSSLVDVLVNNVQTVTGQQVPAGPFLLNTPPIGIDGQGQVRVVVRDALGTEHVLVQPFYQSRYLLRPGLDEFSYEAGFVRNGLGDFRSYGKPMASGTLRHGITDNVTAEGHVEGTAGVGLAELTADMTFPRFGLLSAGLATSFTAAGTGLRGLLGYQFRSIKGFGIAATVTAANPAFRTIGVDALGGGVAEQLLLTVPVHTMGVSFGFLQSHPIGAASTSYGTLGLTGRLGAGTISASATQGIAGAPTSFFLAYISHFGRNTVATRASNSLGVSRVTTDVGTSLPASGLGSAIDVSLNRETGGGSFVGGSYVLESSVAHVDTFVDKNLAVSNLRGGFAFVGGRTFATRELTSSYGLAVVPGYPNVRVYVNGLEVGRTDAEGKAALPFLIPYSLNRITLDQRDLPISANIDAFEQDVVPYFRSAVVVRFVTGRAGGVTLRLAMPDGSAVSAGSVVAGAAGTTFPVGEDGIAYLAAVPAGKSSYRVIVGGDGTCAFSIEAPADVSAIPDLGTVPCTPPDAPPAVPGARAPRETPAPAAGTSTAPAASSTAADRGPAVMITAAPLPFASTPEPGTSSGPRAAEPALSPARRGAWKFGPPLDWKFGRVVHHRANAPR